MTQKHTQINTNKSFILKLVILNISHPWVLA